MNQIDLWVGLAALVFIAFGFLSGFMRSFLSLLWTYLCIYLATNFAPSIIAVFSVLSVEESSIGKVIMILGVYAVGYLIGEVFLFMLKNLVSVSILGPLDKVLGALVTAFKVLIIVGFVFEVVLTLPLDENALRNINSTISKQWGQQVFKISYPLAVSMGARAGQMFSGVKVETPPVDLSQTPDLKLVTAEASKIVGTAAKRFTP
jgi:uncharacterized membrane protein required for colicin V production